MKFDPQDARWTIWVLEPESLSAEEREQFGKLAAENAEFRQFVAELRAAAGMLGGELRSEAVEPTDASAMEAAVLAKAEADAAVEPAKPMPVDNHPRFRW